MNSEQKILQAAERCMREQGFHQTSVQNVAASANVSVGLIYKYFKNKDAIIEALVLNVVKRMKKLLNADFEKISHAFPEISSADDLLPPEVEQSIVLLMEVSAESTRNERINHIMDEAWTDLKQNFITQTQGRYPGVDASVINTRLYMMSLIIDGIIIHRCMKQSSVPDDFMHLFNAIAREVNQTPCQEKGYSFDG